MCGGVRSDRFDAIPPRWGLRRTSVVALSSSARVDPLRRRAIINYLSSRWISGLAWILFRIVGQRATQTIWTNYSNSTTSPLSLPVWDVGAATSMMPDETAGILLGRTTIEGWAVASLGESVVSE